MKRFLLATTVVALAACSASTPRRAADVTTVASTTPATISTRPPPGLVDVFTKQLTTPYNEPPAQYGFAPLVSREGLDVSRVFRSG